jgi:hypothetical protein
MTLTSTPRPRLPLRPGAFYNRSRCIRKFSIGSRCSHSLAPPSHPQRPQRPGDVIYVPDSWGHGILNLEESAAYAQVRKMLGRL